MINDTIRIRLSLGLIVVAIVHAILLGVVFTALHNKPAQPQPCVLVGDSPRVSTRILRAISWSITWGQSPGMYACFASDFLAGCGEQQVVSQARSTA